MVQIDIINNKIEKVNQDYNKCSVYQVIKYQKIKERHYNYIQVEAMKIKIYQRQQKKIYLTQKVKVNKQQRKNDKLLND